MIWEKFYVIIHGQTLSIFLKIEGEKERREDERRKNTYILQKWKDDSSW